jgi:PHD/YefM family antitoxin component YafN of YafNO toxin-antitoxin module
MAEQFTSITNARKTLPVLSQSAQGGDERYIITNQGKPQAVLIGYGEYQGIMAATELINRPLALASLERGLRQKTQLSFQQVKKNLQRRKLAKTHTQDSTAPLSVPEPAFEEPFRDQLDEINRSLRKIMAQLEGQVVARHSLVEGYPQIEIVKSLKTSLATSVPYRTKPPRTKTSRLELKTKSGKARS